MKTVYYQIDISEKTGADYKAGADMMWDNYGYGDSKADAIRQAKWYFEKEHTVNSIRVDRNCLKEGAESLATIFTLFR